MRSSLIAIALISCGPNVPPGVECAGTLEAGSDAELSSALSSAAAGDCILLADGAYAGPIALPAGVLLVAEVDAAPRVSGGSPAVIRAGEGGGIHGITISSGPSQGILIEASEFTIDRTKVFDVVDAAVGIRCEDPGCLRGQITLDELEIRRARSGLVLSGANARITSSAISDAATTGVSGGGAIYVANGGVLSAESLEISDSEYGAVADGAGTELHLRSTVVRDCASAGVWAQGLRGTAAAPALTLEGGTAISGHAGAGVLLLDSAGASIAGASITGTTLRSTVLPNGMNAEIGDGLLLLSSSAQISVQSTELRGNARAQAILDSPGAGVVFGTNTVDATNGQWKVVVQNGGMAPMVPAQDLSTAPLLPVLSEPIVVPSI